MKCATVILCCGAVLVGASSAGGRTWYVPSECPTVKAGIDSASAGDTVLVACGTYEEYSIWMKSGVCLRSETGDPECVTIDAHMTGRGISFSSADSTTRVEGIKIVNGTNPEGGCVGCSDSSPQLTDCVFSNGQVLWFGGGMYCSNSSPTLTNCTFLDNTAPSQGGGVYCAGSSPTFINCTFSGNQATQEGGGVYCWRCSSATFLDCTFSDNTAIVNPGGGINVYCSDTCPTTVSGCIFDHNESGNSGGGIYSQGLTTVTNCTFFGNGAGNGGGLHFSGASGTVENTIIAFSTQGGAIYCPNPADVPTLSCCDLFGNVGGDWSGLIADSATVNGNMAEDPKFCNPPAGEFGLGADSPCLAANNSCGVQIGAEGEACTAEYAQRVESRSWSAVKALYR